MSNTVEVIVNQLRQSCIDNLPSDWSELCYVYDIESNEFLSNFQRYGVKPGLGETINGVIKNATFRQTFELLLVNRYENIKNDVSLRTVILDLYDKSEEIVCQVFQKRLAIPSTVLVVEQVTYLEPEVLDEHNVVVLTTQLEIQYRKQLP